MRVMILTLILLVPLSSNCFAISNGELYESCKPFSGRVFEVKTSADMACLAYFRGIADTGEQICGSVKEVIARPDISTDEKAVLNSVILIYGIGFTGNNKLKPAIQLVKQ